MKIISTRRSLISMGSSLGVTFPQDTIPEDKKLRKDEGNKVSVVAGDGLLLIDMTGEVPENSLFIFFKEYIDPNFDNWWQKEKKKEEFVTMEIPRWLWKRLYQVSGDMKSSQETYAEAQKNALYGAINNYCEEKEKRLDKHEEI